MRSKATLLQRLDIGLSEGMVLGVLYASAVALFQHLSAQFKGQPTQLNLYVMGGAVAFALAHRLIYRLISGYEPPTKETPAPWRALPDDDGSSYGGVGRWAGIVHGDEEGG